MIHSFTDLHTHILPNMDDGACNLEMSLEMLSVQKNEGIDRLALTPHYYPGKESLESFLCRREKAYDSLKSYIDINTMPQLIIGAEVRYSPKLAEMEIEQLKIGNTRFLLLELPDRGVVPLLAQVLDSILCRDIVPILAHIERCEMLRKEPELIFQYVQMGALAQITASALDSIPDTFALACFRNGLAHIISSDAHKPGDCIHFLNLKHYNNIVPWAEKFARAIWENAPLPAFSITPVKKGFFGYR